MPELRRDPIVGRWVIISTERSGRPQDVHTVRRFLRQPSAPLSRPGTADPREILAYRPHASEPDGPNWTIARHFE